MAWSHVKKQATRTTTNQCISMSMWLLSICLGQWQLVINPLLLMSQSSHVESQKQWGITNASLKDHEMHFEGRDCRGTHHANTARHNTLLREFNAFAYLCIGLVAPSSLCIHSIISHIACKFTKKRKSIWLNYNTSHTSVEVWNK